MLNRRQVAIDIVRVEGDRATVVLVPDTCDPAVRHATATSRAIGIQHKLCIVAGVDFAGDEGYCGQGESNAHVGEGGKKIFWCHRDWYNNRCRLKIFVTMKCIAGSSGLLVLL